jgi:hypothetical protein
VSTRRLLSRRPHHLITDQVGNTKKSRQIQAIKAPMYVSKRCFATRRASAEYENSHPTIIILLIINNVKKKNNK